MLINISSGVCIGLVSMCNMLNNFGMFCENYNVSMVGWVVNGNSFSSVNFGVNNFFYGD